MDLDQQFINLIELIIDNLEVPPVDRIFIPNQEDLTSNNKKANFGAIQLKNGSTGIFFIAERIA